MSELASICCKVFGVLVITSFILCYFCKRRQIAALRKAAFLKKCEPLFGQKKNEVLASIKFPIDPRNFNAEVWQAKNGSFFGFLQYTLIDISSDNSARLDIFKLFIAEKNDFWFFWFEKNYLSRPFPQLYLRPCERVVVEEKVIIDLQWISNDILKRIKGLNSTRSYRVDALLIHEFDGVDIFGNSVKKIIDEL